MRHLTATLIVYLLIICSCHDRKPGSPEISKNLKSYPYTIDINEGLKNQTDLKLSDIADSIKYILLSKDKQVLTREFLFLQMADNDLFIQLGTLIHRFDKSGKFLNVIGQIGRGPNEYLGGSTFAINPDSKKVYVYRNYKLDFVAYDFSGNYLTELPLKCNHDIGTFLCLSDSMFVIFPVYLRVVPNDMFLCGVFDQNGSRLTSIKHPAQNIPNDFDITRFVVGGPFDINAFFRNEIISMCDFDTVYKINKDSIYPAFIFNWSNLPRPITFEQKYYIGGRPKNVIANPKKLFETSSKAIFLIKDKTNIYLVEYDKYTGTTKSMFFSNDDDIGFINDIDGGSHFFPEWTNRAGDIWIKATEALAFKQIHNDGSLPKNPSAHSEESEKLRSFLNELKIDDNTVLELVYLKKY